MEVEVRRAAQQQLQLLRMEEIESIAANHLRRNGGRDGGRDGGKDGGRDGGREGSDHGMEV